ncbi:hypothetical protein AC1031_011565 [Aphanomyces cochlioides]|nr:hypothetical protein AC1031_011565 [Aphanomyces cochlioides]
MADISWFPWSLQVMIQTHSSIFEAQQTLDRFPPSSTIPPQHSKIASSQIFITALAFDSVQRGTHKFGKLWCIFELISFISTNIIDSRYEVVPSKAALWNIF